MWRNPYSIQWAAEDGFLFVKASWEGVDFALPPFGPDSEIIEAVNKWEKEFREAGKAFEMQGVEGWTVALLDKLKPGDFDFKAERGNFDYVYNAQDLIYLRGRKYHGKKNHANSFRRVYSSYNYFPLTTELVDQCLSTSDEWYRKKVENGDTDPSLADEHQAIVDALSNFVYLGLAGGVITVNDKVEAFAFGEQTNEDMAVIHVEKANPDIKGLYAVINQDFCANSWSHVRYINREEDMGIEGLRQAKLSYHPVKFVKKYTVTRK
jgi:hypothetical protein